MGFRFRRSVKLFPGVRLNFGKKGTSVSIGPRGAKVTVGPSGTRTTVGIPGTGISYTETVGSKRQDRLGASASQGIDMSYGIDKEGNIYWKVCPHCGRHMRKKWDQCPACGGALPERVRCPACGTVFGADAVNFCPMCGRRMKADLVDIPEKPKGPADGDMRKAMKEKHMVQCAHCYMIFPQSCHYCPACGEPNRAGSGCAGKILKWFFTIFLVIFLFSLIGSCLREPLDGSGSSRPQSLLSEMTDKRQ